MDELRRKQKDHERYILNREQRLERQRAYYRANKDKYSWRHLSEVYENKRIGYEYIESCDII